MSEYTDFSGVFNIDSESSSDDLQFSLSMRLSELSAVTLMLANRETDDCSAEEMSRAFWHLHHSLEDARAVLNASIFKKETAEHQEIIDSAQKPQ